MKSYNIWVLTSAQAITTQVDRQGASPVGSQDTPDTLRICKFLRMNPLEFMGLKLNEHSKNFVEKTQKVIQVMHIADVKCVELVFISLRTMLEYDMIS